MTGDTGVVAFRDDAPMETIETIRMNVFVEEQGVPKSEEMDGRDAEAIQFLARADDTPVGTARLRLPEPGVGKAERVAVLEPYRGEGWGRRLMTAIERVAREEGLDEIVLHGQTAVEGFYHALGYETTSDVFEEAGIPHVEMKRRLEPNS